MQVTRKDVIMDHDYRTCDCYRKVDRLIELSSKPQRTALEELERRFIKFVLDTCVVYA